MKNLKKILLHPYVLCPLMALAGVALLLIGDADQTKLVGFGLVFNSAIALVYANA